MTGVVPRETDSDPPWATLDLRSLALLRVLLGLFILVDCLKRWGSLSAFTTDQGVLSRVDFVTSPFADRWLCFHLGGGDLLTQQILHLLLTLCGLGLVLGWRTLWMNLGCWVLLSSLHVRNIYVNDRGDLELILILFWSLFLPLGARWSFDAMAGRSPTGWNSGLAPAALILQFAQIYLFAGLLKTGEFWLVRGDGLSYSLQSPLFATPLAEYLHQRLPEAVLISANYAAIAGEIFIGLLLLSPIAVAIARPLALGLILAFHSTVAVLFHLGMFPVLGGLLPLALLPPSFWGHFPQRLRTVLDQGRRNECNSTSPPTGVALLLAGLMLTALLSNLAYRPVAPNLKLPEPFLTLSKVFRLEQHWELFAPIPPYLGSFELQFREPSGEFQTMLTRPKNSQAAESGTSEPFPDHRWRMLMISSLFPQGASVRPGIARELWRGLEKKQSGIYRYLFRVRQVQKDGGLGAEEVWILWSGHLGDSDEDLS